MSANATAMETAMSDLLAWLESHLAEAKKNLAARVQAAETWSGGSDATWRAVGAKESRDQRLELAARERRISKQYQRDVACYLRLIEIVKSHAAGE